MKNIYINGGEKIPIYIPRAKLFHFCPHNCDADSNCVGYPEARRKKETSHQRGVFHELILDFTKRSSEAIVSTPVRRIYASNMYPHIDCIMTKKQSWLHRDSKCIESIYIYIIIFLSPYIYICMYISLSSTMFTTCILYNFITLLTDCIYFILLDRYWHCIVYTRHVDIMRKFIANMNRTVAG